MVGPYGGGKRNVLAIFVEKTKPYGRVLRTKSLAPKAYGRGTLPSRFGSSHKSAKRVVARPPMIVANKTGTLNSPTGPPNSLTATYTYYRIVRIGVGSPKTVAVAHTHTHTNVFTRDDPSSFEVERRRRTRDSHSGGEPSSRGKRHINFVSFFSPLVHVLCLLPAFFRFVRSTNNIIYKRGRFDIYIYTTP